MICPTCHAKFDPESSNAKPFCSPRCQQIDLGRWLDERNALPHIDPEADEVPEGDEPARPADRDAADAD